MSRRIILLLFSTIIIINKSKQQQQQHKDISDCQLNGLEQTITWSKSADFSRINHPKTINIWFGEKINLTYRDNHKRKLPKTWLWQTGHNFNEGYRLTESIECFVIENRTHLEPYTEINSLLIHKDGIYVLALIESDWHIHVQIGLQESYIPLAIFIVSVLKPVSISYTLRFITYHSDHECYDAEYKIWWIFQVLLNNKLLNIQNKPLLDSKFQYKTKEAKCLRLSNDDSPIQIIYYYNINRVKVTPNGYTPASEAQWKVIKSYKNYTIEENYTVDLSTEFGIVMRIRLKNIQVPFGNGMKITLKSISDEGLWKLGHMTPPFTDDKLLHQVYAVVRLNSTIYNLLREKPDQLNIQWILVEPLYGRLRTSNGITVQMNLYHHWTTAQYLTKLEINHLKLSDFTSNMLIDEIIYETPFHIKDIHEIRKAIYNERPLPSGEIRQKERACFTKANNYATTFIHVNLNNPKQCIETDHDKFNVRKHIESPHSSMIAYSIKLLTDEYGNEWKNITGFIIINIKMRSYSRTSREEHSEQGCDYYTNGEYGEIMRLGFLEIGQTDIKQYLTRWEDRWLAFHDGHSERYVFINEFDRDQVTPENIICPPHSTSLEISYHIDTKHLKAAANDTNQLLLNVTLQSHPAWMSLEMFTDPTSENCPGCFVSIYIDRRTVQQDIYSNWLESEEGINDWNQIQYPKPVWANYINRQIIVLSQNFHEKSEPITSAQNIMRRTLSIIRQLANPINISVAVLQVNTYCMLGQYQVYHTPAVCAYCPPGTFSINLTPNEFHPTYACQLCPKGTFQTLPGQGACLDCRGGSSTKDEGAWYEDLCTGKIERDSDPKTLRNETYTKGASQITMEIKSSSSSSLSKPTTHNWIDDPPDVKIFPTEIPVELSIVSTQRLVFNIICFLLLLGCIMGFVIISKGYMLVRLTNRTRVHLIERRKMMLEARTSEVSIRKSAVSPSTQRISFDKKDCIIKSDDESSKFD